MRSGNIYLGVSGWTYESWRGAFYPKDLPRRRELNHISRRFNSVEINASFYSLLKPETYRKWRDVTEAKFRFAVKGSRFITHNKKLAEVRTPLANFFASGLLALKEKLGPILWQLPESAGVDVDRLSAFLDLLPHDTEAAADLASRHDERLEGRSFTEVDRNRRLRHVLEVREQPLLTPAAVRTVRRNGVALVFSDSAEWPYTEEITAGFVYLRLHGSEQTYASRYDNAELDRWARRIQLWRSAEEPEDAARITARVPPRRLRRDVYVYFDNDRNAHAPNDALRLAERLDLTSE